VLSTHGGMMSISMFQGGYSLRFSERFVAAYNRIEREMTKRAKLDRYVGFAQLVRRLARTDSTIAQFADELFEYGELRNAIVHDAFEPGRLIAEPHPDVVERMEHIAEVLERPPLVIPEFERKVYTVRSQDSILDVMGLIRQLGYTQFPVYDQDGKFAGLLTDRCLARWLTFELDKVRENSLEEITVAHVTVYDKTKGRNVTFLPKKATVFDAYNEFECRMGIDGPRLEAILITERGKKDEPLLGIITPWDIFRLRSLMG
jgi:CBS domain-containing protein